MHVGGSSLESAVLTCYSMHIIACKPDLVNPCISWYHLIKVLTRKGYFLDPICNCFHRQYKMRAFERYLLHMLQSPISPSLWKWWETSPVQRVDTGVLFAEHNCEGTKTFWSVKIVLNHLIFPFWSSCYSIHRVQSSLTS